MKTKTKVIGIVIVLAVAAGIGTFYFLSLPKVVQNKTTGTVVDQLFGWKFPVAKFPSTGSGGALAYSDIRDPGGIPQGFPVRLQIPVIGVDSAIEDAVITSDGRMDVPSGTIDVAWFSLGPHPGDVGSAVIGGHYGIQNGVPFVFYNLDKLKAGDKIYIVNDKNDTLAFQIRSIASFDRNADATTVFTSHDGLAHLNLITCEGIWNQVNGTYPERLVVFTDAIPAEGAAPAATITASATFNRSLNVGTQGQDVAALQTALAQKGFLTMPPGVLMGIFGTVTRTAVAKYQVSEGLLPSVGFFGPQTRARLIAELESGPVLPNAGSGPNATSSNAQNPSAARQGFMSWVESLYATPLDGFITLLLLIAIIFIVFKIIKR